MKLTNILIIGTVAAILVMPSGQLVFGPPIQGGGGDDYIVGTNGDDTINLKGGDDQGFGLDGNDIIKGGGGFDHLVGGNGIDQIHGGEGPDTISGEDGNDVLDGGDGDDKINGDMGNDVIDAGTGDDIADGGQGNDNIKGGSGDDVLIGGEGDDDISGKTGNDLIQGGSGNDALFADDGDDTLFGNEGDDTLTGGLGQNDLDGGNGAEVIGDTCNWDGGPTFDDGNPNGPGTFIDPVTLLVIPRDDTIVNCESDTVIDPVLQGGGPPGGDPAEDTDYDDIVAAINDASGKDLKKKNKNALIQILDNSKSLFASADDGCPLLSNDFRAQVIALQAGGDMSDSLRDILIGASEDAGLLAVLEGAKGCL